MIRLWNARRELQRVKVQAQAIPLGLYESLVQRRHDRSRPERIAVTIGALPATDEGHLGGFDPVMGAEMRALEKGGMSRSTMVSAGDVHPGVFLVSFFV